LNIFCGLLAMGYNVTESLEIAKIINKSSIDPYIILKVIGCKNKLRLEKVEF